jgi:hypothetical protein
MEMPTPCSRCGCIFELHQGRGFGDTMYCKPCGSELHEERELENEDYFNESNSFQDEEFSTAIAVEVYLEENPCSHTEGAGTCLACIRNAVEAVDNRMKN